MSKIVNDADLQDVAQWLNTDLKNVVIELKKEPMSNYELGQKKCINHMMNFLNIKKEQKK